jgi:hypothetical protein
MVFCSECDLNGQLIESVRGIGSDSAEVVGLFISRGLFRDLSKLILMAKGVWLGIGQKQIVDCDLLTDAGYVFHRNYSRLNRNAERGQIETAIRGDNALLRLRMHSDGFDAGVNSGFAFCPLKGSGRAALVAASSQLECLRDGFCHRLHLANAVAENSARLIEPEKIKGFVVFLDSCNGAQFVENSQPRPTYLAYRLLVSPLVIVLILRRGELLLPLIQTDEVLSAILGGIPIGRAIGNSRSANLSHHCADELVLFGDPAIYLRYPLDVVYKATPPSERHPFSSNSTWLEILQSVILSIEARSNGGAIRSIAQACLAEIHRKTDQGANCAPPQIDGLLSDLLTELIAIRSWARWLEDWSQFAVRQHINTEANCPLCGGRAHVVTYALTQALKRQTLSCVECRLEADVSDALPVLQIAKSSDSEAAKLNISIGANEPIAAKVIHVPQNMERSTIQNIDADRAIEVEIQASHDGPHHLVVIWYRHSWEIVTTAWHY